MRFRRKELLQIAFRRPARCNLILMKKRSAGDARRAGEPGLELSFPVGREASAKVARQRMVNVSGRNRSMAGSDGDLMKIRDHVADGI
jgi:hypothetical protein